MKMTLAAFFLSMAYVLPFITGQIPEIGSMLCPMHIPVLLCGFFCGPVWGFVVGIAAPLIRSLTLTMPPLYPTAFCMAFELAAYGGLSGFMYKLLPRKKIYIYSSLLIAMTAGRMIWGIVMYLCMTIGGNSFTFSAFLTAAVANALPGIIIQIALIPPAVMLLEKTNLFENRGNI